MSKKQNQGCLLLFIPFAAVCICIVLLMSELSVGGFDSFLDSFGATVSKLEGYTPEDIKKMVNVRNSIVSRRFEIDSSVWEDVTRTYGTISDTLKPRRPTIWVAY